jgi:septal ring factor EnvC (AmiA/AmiB activator)
MLKRFPFFAALFAAATTVAVAADAPGSTSLTAAKDVSAIVPDLQMQVATLQTQTAALTKQVAQLTTMLTQLGTAVDQSATSTTSLGKQVAALEKHTHTYETDVVNWGMVNVNQIKADIQSSSFVNVYLPVSNSISIPSNQIKAQTSPAVMS